MSDYKKEALKVYNIMDRAKTKREEIVNSGLSSQKMTEMLNDLKAKTTAEIKELNDELELLASFDVISATEEVDKARRTGRDTQLMLYHQNRARSAFDGYTGDELLLKYPEIADTLQDDEKKYLYCYEDELKGRVRGAVDLDSVMFAHKTIEEKLAVVDKGKVANFINHDKTIRGLISEEVGSVLNGEKPAGHDFASLIDDMQA